MLLAVKNTIDLTWFDRDKLSFFGLIFHGKKSEFSMLLAVKNILKSVDLTWFDRD